MKTKAEIQIKLTSLEIDLRGLNEELHDAKHYEDALNLGEDINTIKLMIDLLKWVLCED